MEAWIPRIYHLRPPYGGAPKIECHRFSPYFFQSDRWTNGVRPQAWYAGIFPSALIDLNRVAYYFEADWKDVLGDPAYDGVLQATLQWVRLWREEAELPQLKIRSRDESGIDIVDTRYGRLQCWRLDALETAVYSAVDAPANVRNVFNKVTSQTSFEYVTPETIASLLNDFDKKGIVLHENGHYLAGHLLVTLHPGRDEYSLRAFLTGLKYRHG